MKQSNAILAALGIGAGIYLLKGDGQKIISGGSGQGGIQTVREFFSQVGDTTILKETVKKVTDFTGNIGEKLPNVGDIIPDIPKIGDLLPEFKLPEFPNLLEGVTDKLGGIGGGFANTVKNSQSRIRKSVPGATLGGTLIGGAAVLTGAPIIAAVTGGALLGGGSAYAGSKLRDRGIRQSIPGGFRTVAPEKALAQNLAKLNPFKKKSSPVPFKSILPEAVGLKSVKGSYVPGIGFVR